MKNWKTTSTGIAMIVGGIVSIYFQRHNLTEVVVTTSVATILGGIGLIFAKDSNVTGGTTQQ